MEGLRTSLPGVQVLFAFLLTAPLQSGFERLDAVERRAFLIAFFAAAIASILLIAPSVHQRVRAPISGLPRRTMGHLHWATWLALAGSVVMAVALGAAVYLVSRLVAGDDPAVALTAIGAALLIWAWFYLPLVTFRNQDG